MINERDIIDFLISHEEEIKIRGSLQERAAVAYRLFTEQIAPSMTNYEYFAFVLGAASKGQLPVFDEPGKNEFVLWLRDFLK